MRKTRYCFKEEGTRDYGYSRLSFGVSTWEVVMKIKRKKWKREASYTPDKVCAYDAAPR
jgi:hypothetical protein